MKDNAQVLSAWSVMCGLGLPSPTCSLAHLPMLALLLALPVSAQVTGSMRWRLAQLPWGLCNCSVLLTPGCHLPVLVWMLVGLPYPPRTIRSIGASSLCLRCRRDPLSRLAWAVAQMLPTCPSAVRPTRSLSQGWPELMGLGHRPQSEKSSMSH